MVSIYFSLKLHTQIYTWASVIFRYHHNHASNFQKKLYTCPLRYLCICIILNDVHISIREFFRWSLWLTDTTFPSLTLQDIKTLVCCLIRTPHHLSFRYHIINYSCDTSYTDLKYHCTVSCSYALFIMLWYIEWKNVHWANGPCLCTQVSYLCVSTFKFSTFLFLWIY